MSFTGSMLRPIVLSACCIVAVAASGCGGGQSSSLAAPETFPVTGKVMTPDGQPAMAGATIMFEPVDAGSVQFASVGEVGSDGTFTLRAITPGGERLTGAVKGLHRVTLTTPIAADQSGGESIALPETHTVFSKENHFEIEVTPP